MSRPQPPALLLRYALIVIVIAALAGAFAWVAGWIRWPGSEPALTPARMIDAFEDSMGRHAGFRRNHAKGVCVSGYFDSNGNGAALSRASVFERGRTPVIGRLSAPGSDPARDDADASVRSFALLFSLRNGEQWRTAMNSAPIFQVATPEALYEQLVALRPDARSGQPDPAKLNAFLAKHPETIAFRQWVDTHPPSTAFHNASYFGIDAFRFVDADGNARFVRWSVVPDTPYAPSNELTNPARDPDFLAHDLDLRLQTGPVSWRLMLTPAGPGDPIDDATRAWPAERELHRVDAGTIVIERAESQIDGACRDINFDPLILPYGIAPSADPLLAARSAAYAVSFNRRTREEAGIGAHRR
ncbi:catalase family peroxidase [Paraburkholderia aromaticivorans]|uniref:catalase family peroxidase n=1 Tax=Paraburkholderia aromaticivorans TaxID=2026199 RepID=UPI001455E3BE|nr:catalase family peroxidase [Paraburkholderia aromaticivorans]